jgi:hypothetical protein
MGATASFLNIHYFILKENNGKQLSEAVLHYSA